MGGRWAVRAATALALTFVVVPLLGQEEREPVVSVEGELGGSVGRMSVPRPVGCSASRIFWGPHQDGVRSEAGTFGGGQARVGLKSRPRGKQWRHRVVAEVSGELRQVQPDNEPDPVSTGLARATLGWSSRYGGLRLGGWTGNVGVNERWRSHFSGSLRLGPPRLHVKFSFFDQPSCYLSQCLWGGEFFVAFDSVALRLGGSSGGTALRAYMEAPFQLGEGLVWLHPGFQLGWDENLSPIFAVTLAVGFGSSKIRFREPGFALPFPGEQGEPGSQWAPPL